MSGTLVGVFIGVALLCVIAGVVAVSRTRQDSREDEEQVPEMTYAEEQAAVAAAEAAEASALRAQDEDDEEPLS